MTTRCRRPTLRYVGGSPDAILCIVRSSAARSTQVTDAEMTARMDNIRLLKLWNTDPSTIVLETTNPPLPNRAADDVPVSAEDDMFLVNYKRLHLARSDV